MTDTVTDRFLRYVVIDTQSDASSSTQPTTQKQLDLGRILVTELLEIGLTDAPIWTNMVMSMQPSPPMSTRTCRSFVSVRTWIRRPISQGQM
ncbi:di/tripeptidase [Phyllobacterium ifriqiyense]|uniref:Di/tripeptidase n=1 Tax=Phyllobacterium ifriqiyense TaxID=314238 RepID=A0ABU0S7W9_9HYPH|nr:di/tripeptidase [Phyllobacterium ifriqiyense]